MLLVDLLLTVERSNFEVPSESSPVAKRIVEMAQRLLTAKDYCLEVHRRPDSPCFSMTCVCGPLGDIEVRIFDARLSSRPIGIDRHARCFVSPVRSSQTCELVVQAFPSRVHAAALTRWLFTSPLLVIRFPQTQPR